MGTSSAADLTPYELSVLLIQLLKFKSVLGSSRAAVLDDTIRTLRVYADRINPCRYTFPHNRHYCGSPLCPEGEAS